MRIKNWQKFQHYQSGRGSPPWIKLYRDLLNDKNWFALEPSAAKFLISCWILAAEYDGNLPDSETIAFRLRLASKDVARYITLCKEWIITDASNVLADCYQLAIPETETETETETDKINKRTKVSLVNLSTDHVKDWLKEKQLRGEYINYDADFVLEKFKQYCEAKGKTYSDYVAAYRNAFDWDKCKPKNTTRKPQNPAGG